MHSTNSAAAAAAGTCPPEKEAVPGVSTGTGQAVNNQRAEAGASAEGSAGHDGTELEAGRLARKALSSLQAEFALAGHELVQLADGSFVASRWGLVRPLATMDAARAFLQQVTGRKASGTSAT
jgi:hypothetical protein